MSPVVSSSYEGELLFIPTYELVFYIVKTSVVLF